MNGNWIRIARAELVPTGAALLLLLGPPHAAAADESPPARSVVELARGFAAPPPDARPWVYWFWLDGNITREGVTADLEAMSRVGVGGVLIMEVDQGAPKGPVRFGSPAWRDLFRHAVAEAGRLGLQVNMSNDAGWCGSGGPWITPALAMRKVVWSEAAVTGPRRFDEPLRPPPAARDYRDVAVLAFPTPPADAAPGGGYRIQDVEAKAAFVPRRVPSPGSWPAVAADATIPADRVLDLTARLGKEGRLAWDVPAGIWTILRVGHAVTGKDNHPAPVEGRGLECDKLSKEAVDAQFNGLMKKLIDDAGPEAGKTLVATHIDSWEVGSQNWTPLFREEFRRRRGYDPLLFLPVMTGRVVRSLEVSERFLWDLRQTVSDLIAENYAGRMRELAHQHGLRLSIEAYDGCPCDDMTYAGRADEPMCEFWSWGADTAYSCTEMASAAHGYGKRILGAEAFTASDREKWQSHPGSIKALGDWAFCEGVNRFVFHRYALQPWIDRRPGMSMGPWGLHYERTQTWWELSRPWHEYLTRCQFLLQQGLFAADVCYLEPENSPQRFEPPATGRRNQPPDRPGYNFDGCTPEIVRTRMSVKDGRLVLPDGMSYQVLVLPPVAAMTPDLLKKIKELVEAGATVVGDPPRRSPSLADYPRCDAEVARLAAELWDRPDAQPPAGAATEHRRGRGRVVRGRTAEQVLAAAGVRPDFTAGRPWRYIHRRLGDADLYFVANPQPSESETLCTFRVVGKRPELWRPETGRIEAAAVFIENDGCTSLPLRLGPTGSVFVLFRADGERFDPVASATRDGRSILGDSAPAEPTADIHRDQAGGLVIDAWRPGRYQCATAGGATYSADAPAPPPTLDVPGPWTVHFAPSSGAPEQITMERLVSWSEHRDPGVRYFSGAALYRKTFETPAAMIGPGRRLFLDLGDVRVIAEATLNGKPLGILWKPPYRVEVTQALKAGPNALEVKVVNLWPNRMIGDEQLPEDGARNPDGTLREWPKWLLEGRPSPTGRRTFTSWRLWKKDSRLLESGLLGPVRVRAAVRMSLARDPAEGSAPSAR